MDLSTVQAYELRSDRSLISDPNQTITPQAYLDTPVEGDLYLAMKPYGQPRPGGRCYRLKARAGARA